MQEEIADEYVGLLKSITDTAEASISQIAEEAGAKSDEEREAFKQGMKLAPQSALRAESGEVVPLRRGWGEPDWKKVKKLFLKAPEPSPEQREASIRLVQSIPQVLRRAFRETARKLPHAPGGHPFALTDPSQRLAACKRIEAYRISNHMDTAEAIARVALELNRKHHAVGPKTLRRYYDKYLSEHSKAANKTKNRKNKSDPTVERQDI
jgi:hypothetical protein